VAAILAECGVHPALGWLNGRTRFRFTGVYRVHGALLVNLGLFDRENPLLNLAGGASPLDESYCAFAAHTSSAFMTADSRADSRLRLHAKRDIVLSYAGVPIRLAGGGVVGTLCHYDARPRFVAPDELAVLEAVAPAFGEWLFARARAS
jgi:GAF domain-containing protein